MDSNVSSPVNASLFAACRFSLRNATASVARRHQWQTMPIEAPKSLEAVQLDRESVS